MSVSSLLVRNVWLGRDRGLDVRIEGGRIAEIAPTLRATVPTIDGKGGALIPGLHDHHIHLLALAAQRDSVKVGPEDVANANAFRNVLLEAARSGARKWIRAFGYHERVAGPLDRWILDAIVSDKPLRVQYRTGSLWILNSAALAMVLRPGERPGCVEVDDSGSPTGRIWRGDTWLRERIGAEVPNLEAVGAGLARYGVTAVTDASASTGMEEARLLGEAVERGAIPQTLALMSGGYLDPKLAQNFTIGPVKFLLDDAALGDLAPILEGIRKARAWKRNVAFHCVTTGELAFALAALSAAGACPGDRIEHGSIVHYDALEIIKSLELIVVTQPSFIFERGDEYQRDVASDDVPALYRAASIIECGGNLAGSTDAPYGSPDPWRAIATAVDRRTRSGALLGAHERIRPQRALELFLGAVDDPSGTPEQVAVGKVANLCLLQTPLVDTLRRPDSSKVRSTICAGRVVYDSNLPALLPNEIAERYRD